MKSKLSKIFEIIFRIFPVKKNRLLFISNGFKYHDNPYHIYKKFKEKADFNDYEFVWVVNNPSLYSHEYKKM